MKQSDSSVRNYQKKLDEILSNLKASGKKPRLALHACCGPCSSYVLEYLSTFFEITVLFYNPNIYPDQEYIRRRDELLKFYKSFVPAKNVKVIEFDYNPQEFYDAIGIKDNPELAKEKEKGLRCYRCYELRLRKTYEYACQNNFDFFCTSLSISPFKDAEKINSIGQGLCSSKEKPLWLFSDFKKKNGFKRSLELSAEYGLYRQDYCGCIYSLSK